MRKLKCFIASAFGKKDVDKIFAEAIKPVLNKRKIVLSRVDRVEHNDDIDDKIIQLIDQCDFSIADLTYARPSVYYEAGRVHGLNKPVIFTARSDHFQPNKGDEFGNFRIHFDLQMKNIIQWKETTDYFCKRLNARISLVTKPILKQLELEDEHKQEEEAFTRLSNSQKYSNLNSIALESLRKIGFKKYLAAFESTLAIKYSPKGIILVSIIILPSFTKKLLTRLQWGRHWEVISNSLGREKIDTKNIYATRILCCSLRSVPETRITESLPKFCKINEAKIYGYIPVKPKIKGLIFSKEDERYVHFIDNIKSEKDFKLRLSNQLPMIK